MGEEGNQENNRPKKVESGKLIWERNVLKNQDKSNGAIGGKLKKNEKGYRQMRKTESLSDIAIVIHLFFHHTITDKINLFLNASSTDVYFITIRMNDKETHDATIQ